MGGVEAGNQPALAPVDQDVAGPIDSDNVAG